MAEKEKKSFGETSVGKFLKKNLPNAVDLLADSKIPIVSQIASVVEKVGGIAPEQKEEFNQALQDYEQNELPLMMAEQEAVTDRWKSDMSSDSWLSKNVRPITVLYLLLMITVFMLLDSIGSKFKVNESWIDLVKTLVSLVFVAYFGGRTYEKVVNTRQKKIT